MAQVNLGEVLSEIATRLGDPGFVFWGHDELYAYLSEALGVFNSLTGFWKTYFTFDLEPPFTQNWFPANGSGSPRQQTLTDTDIYKLIEYHLIEPPTGATWTGTNQFSMNDLWQSCTRRRNEILQIAACNMVEVSPNCITNANTVPLPDSALDVRRVRWIPAPDQGDPITLQRGDLLSYQRFTPDWLQSIQEPLRWDILSGLEAANRQPPVDALLALVLDALIVVPSQVQVLTVAGGPDFNPPGGNSLLIPNDWAWVLKFGAL
jgi:hypothetical protein